MPAARLARLSGHGPMRELAARGKRARSGPIAVRWSPATGDDPGQGQVAVGYAVARRQGSAVLRNRMRRRVRSIVAELAPGWPAGNYLFNLQAPVATMAHEELREHMERAIAMVQR